MATQWISPTWRMPENSNQSKVDNYSLDYDGTNDYINLSDNFSSIFAGNSWSFSIWLNVSANNSYDCIFAKGLPVQFFIHNNKVKIWLGYPYLTNVTPLESSTSLSLDTWYHIAFTRSGNDNILYINGASDATATSSGSVTTDGASALIGSYSTSYPFQGEMTQATIYDSALSASQITALYNSGTPVNPMALTPLPIAYYPLGGSSTGSASTLTTPNDAVPSATVFDYPSGGADWIDIGNSLSLTSAFTLSSWIKTDTTNASNIFYKNGTVQVAKDTWYDGGVGNRANITLIDSNGLSKNFRSNVAPAGATVTVGTVVDLKNGEWHQIVFTYDGVNQGKLYTDGALTYTYDITDGAWAGNLASNSNNIYLGGTGSLQSWTGELSNAQIWETVLTGAEVVTLYNNGVPLLTGTQPETANLKAWYKMNVDTSTWDGTEWLLSNSGITPTYTTAVELPNSFQNPPAAWPGLTRSDTSWSGTDITLSFWVRYPNGYDGVINYIRASGISIGSITSTNIQFGSGGTYRNFAIGNLQNTAWHNVVVYIPNSSPTFLISDVRCWIDGSEVAGTNIGSGTASQITTISGWGANSSVGTSNLSNWTLFNSDLTGSISTLYNGGTPADVSSLNPVSWYKCDSTNVTFPSPPGTSMTFTDSSSNSNNATGAYDGDGIGGPFPSMTTTNVQAGDGISFGMTTANLVTSDLTRSIPYSSYSMAFDGTASADYIDFGSGILGDESNLSISFWLKPNVVNDNDGVFTISTMVSSQDPLAFFLGSNNLKLYINSAYAWQQDFSSKADTWTHVLLSYDSATAANSKVYINGVEDAGDGTYNFATGNIDASGAGIKVIIGSYYTSAYSLDGEMSNVAVWNSSLSADQALTIYNGGVPNDISSLSPTGWWSLAGDSYYDGTDWICPDLSSSSNNGTSFNMPATALIGDGPGSTANGIATSMDIPANLKGNAPNSSKNAFSVNMNSADRVTSVPG